MAKQSKVHSGNILPLRPRFRHAVRTALESLPFVGDLLSEHYHYPRTITACKGVYGTMEEAQGAVRVKMDPDYDLCNESRSVDADINRVDEFQYEDYPVLYWLQKIVRPGIQIADLGGSTGATFYAYDRALNFPHDLSWLVAELPAAVAAGIRVAEARGEERIKFTADLGVAHQPDLLITLGTLQYMPQRLPKVLSSLGALPPHVIIHRVPTTDGPAFWTIQNLHVAQVPYYIHNRDELVAGMKDLGYRLNDSCSTLRSIKIPHHPDRDIEHYDGFFFSRNASGEP